VIRTTDGVSPRGAFVGRGAELELLSRAMDAAREGEPQIVWIEGEPGIGKTAFIRRFLTAVQGAQVLQASGEESETTLEYGVVLQLIAQATSASNWPELERQIGSRSPASSFTVGADLLGILGPLQDTAPVVVAVDDAHWLDPSSAAALLFVMRRLHGDRLLLLIGSRPGGVEHLGPGWSRLLADPDYVEPISLSGLSGEEISELADSLGLGPLTLAAAERLREHTGGHPLYVKALLTELPGDRLRFGDGPLPAPRSFSATVLARMTNVGADAQALVSAAAVAGPRSQVGFAASVAGLDEPLAGLEEALDAELLVLSPGQLPEEIEFAHPLIRAAVYDDLSPSRRRTLHLACAAHATGSAALGHRVAASHGPDDGLASELLLAAEDEIAASRLAAGVERLLWASRIAASEELRERALLRAVECLVLVGDMPRANLHLDAVLACSDSPRRSYAIAFLTAANGRLLEAEAACREMMERPDYHDDPELDGNASATLALLCSLLGRGDDGVAHARTALDLPGLSPTARTIATQGLCLGLVMSGRGDEAIARLGFLSPARIEPEPFEAELLTSRAQFKAWWGDLAGAAEDLSAVIRWARAGVPFRGIPNAYGGLAEVEYRLGHWNAGLAYADAAVSLGEDSERLWDLPYVRAVASYLNAARGNWSTAKEHADAARRGAELTPLPMCIYYACTAAAHLAWVQGEWEALLRAVAPVLAPLTGGGIVTGLGRRAMQAMVTEAMLSTGRIDEAEELLGMIEGPIDETLNDPTRIEAWRLRGLLESERDRPEQARAAFERGREVAATFEAPLDHALLELAHGQFLRRQGSRRLAIATLQMARDRLRELGANPFLVRCETELTACGVRSRDADADNRYGLTAREDLVARLVASGKSNREVAEELYLSTKAIEYHLGNVFAKVNIHSRHELASRLAAATAETK
jgi:DNA-binding CsgD family transcriptional regulator/tetratricopeptide (TPR) repeat protein